MWARLTALPAFLLLASTVHPNLSQETNPPQNKNAALRIQLVAPPHWEQGCLAFALDRTNSSSSSLYLPDMGLYISVSVNELPNDSAIEGKEAWINVYGLTDIISWEAQEISAGAVVHEKFCLQALVPVVDLDGKSRRLIPLRGKLRIDAYYFPDERTWQKNKSERHDVMYSRTPASTIQHYPEVVTMFADIPCEEASCHPGCERPPPIVRGESRVVPDVFGDPDWGNRGEIIRQKLAQNFPNCSETNPVPH